MTEPLAIKFSNSPSSVKNISISEISFPSLTLLFNKLLKFEGLIITDSLSIWVTSNSSKKILVFLIFGFDFKKDKKSKYTLIFFTGTDTDL